MSKINVFVFKLHSDEIHFRGRREIFTVRVVVSLRIEISGIEIFRIEIIRIERYSGWRSPG